MYKKITKIAVLLDMIKFKHTVFALPFMLMGAFLAQGGVPGATVLFWVILAMAGARTCAMGFNRIVDADFDTQNPRTAGRAIPAGQVKQREAWTMVIISGLVFFGACYQLNPFTFFLSPFFLAITLLYSFSKRFTWLCHLVLGLSLACSPLGGFIAVKGALTGFPWVLPLGVLFWVAGFDTVYACLDVDFDRQMGLYSLPARVGRKNSFSIAACFHLTAFILFCLTGVFCGLNSVYYIGMVVTGGALVYQHLIVKPSDFSRINMSFFTMNGLISLTLFIFTWLSLITDQY
ncbi:MAG: UbiA-like polyprenyltransferase [Thermodesulfobacteriota bacterium]